MTARQAAQKMMAERGYVVIGYPGDALVAGEPGDLVTRFAGQSILPFNLRGDAETDRADWEAQCSAIFGSPLPAQTGRNSKSDGERFWRCTLVMSANGN